MKPFTGKGSETVASEAISAGVTDYMQKEHGTDQYEILANRIENAVVGYRLQHSSAERGRRLETLTSNLPGIVYQCYNEDGWPMVSVEGECQELTGYSSDVLERGEVTYGADIIHPQDRDEVQEAVQEAVASNEPFEMTYRILTIDETKKWVWERGRVAYSEPDGTNVIEGFVTDITNRDEGGKHELARNPARFSTLFRNIRESVAYCEFSGDDAVILDVNPAFEDTFGFDAEELIGEKLEPAIIPSQGREEARKLSQRVKRGEVVETDIQCQTADGVRTFDYRAVPIDIEGETPKTYALFTDLTEQKQNKRQIQRLEYFAERLSHDLRNPLTVAQGNLKLLNKTGSTEYYESANKALARIETLISDILTLAQTGEQISLNEYQSIELETVAERAWSLLRHESATLTVEESATIHADASRFQQILENLFRNAIEHGPDDVSIRVGVLSDKQGFYVADDGPGIPTANHEKVFEVEFSTKEDGTGLGLATISQLVDAHDWELRITESEEGGARFELYDIGLFNEYT